MAQYRTSSGPKARADSAAVRAALPCDMRTALGAPVEPAVNSTGRAIRRGNAREKAPARRLPALRVVRPVDGHGRTRRSQVEPVQQPARSVLVNSRWQSVWRIRAQLGPPPGRVDPDDRRPGQCGAVQSHTNSGTFSSGRRRGTARRQAAPRATGAGRRRGRRLPPRPTRSTSGPRTSGRASVARASRSWRSSARPQPGA